MLHVSHRFRVLEERDRAAELVADRAGDDAVAVRGVHARRGPAEVRRSDRAGDHVAVGLEHADHRVARRRLLDDLEQCALVEPKQRDDARLRRQAVGDVDRGELEVVVERRAHLAGREQPDDDREQQQDRERQPGRDRGESPADRQALEAAHWARIT